MWWCIHTPRADGFAKSVIYDGTHTSTGDQWYIQYAERMDEEEQFRMGWGVSPGNCTEDVWKDLYHEVHATWKRPVGHGVTPDWREVRRETWWWDRETWIWSYATHMHDCAWMDFNKTHIYTHTGDCTQLWTIVASSPRIIWRMNQLNHLPF